jgi:hypothetical protein
MICLKRGRKATEKVLDVVRADEDKKMASLGRTERAVRVIAVARLSSNPFQFINIKCGVGSTYVDIRGA